jgi:two-component system, OmpR family, phosphate regulon sensor histidine kinase PhoR
MKKSIFLKLYSGYFFIIVILTVLIALVSFQLIKSFHLRVLSSELRKLGAVVTDRISPYLENNKIEGLDELVKDLGRELGTRLTIVNNDGVVLADSDEEPAVMEDHKFRPEIIKAFTGEPGQSVRYSRTVKEDMLYIGLPVVVNGEVSYVLRLSRYLSDISKFLIRIRWRLLSVMTVILILALAAAVFYSRSFSKPINELGAASRRIASGEFDTKVFIKQRGELQELASSYNFMTDRIKRLFSELNTRKDELAGIINSIEEGLITLEEEGRILLWNKSFENMVQAKDLKEKLYWEVIRDPDFNRFIKKVQTDKVGHSAEIRVQEKIYMCSAAYIEARDEIVVTFRDVTKIKSVEKIKRDFVVNVSHELRTPLTSIKGYLETIEEETKGDQSKYLEIVKRNTDRLINIVNDLLLLSELESGEIKHVREEVDILSVIENVMKIFEQKIKDKNLDFELKAVEGLPKVSGDAYRLEQMFINLIDNALKYTEKGTISIKADRINDELEILVEDTGIGIQEKDLPRLFERFYVVDKSRSRQVGGTGLGLSIVKHIVLLHEGTIDVTSRPGVGTIFSIRIPV